MSVQTTVSNEFEKRKAAEKPHFEYLIKLFLRKYVTNLFEFEPFLSDDWILSSVFLY